MDDAIKRVKRLAASALARRDRTQEELDALTRELEQRKGDQSLAIDAGEDGLATELTVLVNELTAQVEGKRSELAEMESHYQEVKAQIGHVKQASEDLERAKLRAPVDAAMPDPFAPTPEERALENVRHHIDTLTAEADLNDELAPRRDRELERKLAELEAKEKEQDARAQLAALKAAKKKEKEAAAEAASKPPKKTM